MSIEVESNGSYAMMVTALMGVPKAALEEVHPDERQQFLEVLGDLEFIMESFRQRFHITREETLLASMHKKRIKYEPMNRHLKES